MVLRNREKDAVRAAEKIYGKHIEFWKAIQFLFFEQWKELKTYANEKGIEIIGDLPIYVSLDSVDVWAQPELFQLDENKVPKEVAGCPPDGFSADGQLWGNPLFDWDYMEKTNFAWWVQRIHYLCHVYDTLRIDHFRGFDTYFAIPYGDTTARNGHWKQGPGMKLFYEVERAIGRQPIIAEDLGYLTDSVRKLLEDSGFPGMKVLEFAFDSRDASGNEYLPHNYIRNCVAYAGTHDNDTILGWFADPDADPEDIAYCKEYLNISEGEELNWSMMNALWGSVADLAIVQAQDILGLGSEARMNEPSTVGNNWLWRAKEGAFTQELAEKIRRKMKIYGRLA
jgi:4-alpha-glucanotransferase